MFVQQGEYNGEQIVPRQWINDTRHANDQARINFAEIGYGAMMPGGHYRNQVWVDDAEKGILVAIGIHGQVIYMNMQTQVVIVKLSTDPEPASALFQDSFVAMREISEAV
jgi:CubicO group peptidase (beta-lactamase class C family)